MKLLGTCFSVINRPQKSSSNHDNGKLTQLEFPCKVIAGVSSSNAIFMTADASKWTTLSWDVRMKIMLSLAKCLSFLHHEAQVTHRSFFASNILLDSDNNVKLADFGLVVEEQIGGLSVKDDVYMFGVVLLQMLSGRQVVDNSRLPGEQNLVEWAMPYITNKRRVFRVMDARLEGRYPSSGVLRTAELVVRCLSAEPRLRPDMKEVVKALEQIQDSQ